MKITKAMKRQEISCKYCKSSFTIWNIERGSRGVTLFGCPRCQIIIQKHFYEVSEENQAPPCPEVLEHYEMDLKPRSKGLLLRKLQKAWKKIEELYQNWDTEKVETIYRIVEELHDEVDDEYLI